MFQIGGFGRHNHAQGGQIGIYAITSGQQGDEAASLPLELRQVLQAAPGFGFRDAQSVSDPLGFGGGDWNLYRYVGNNPVNWIDPLGLDEWSVARIEKEVARYKRAVYPSFAIGDERWSKETSTPEGGRKLINAMLGPFEAELRASAYRNCIPVWLLASVIIGELIDRRDEDSWDPITGVFVFGGGIGPAQVRVTTALSHNPPRQRNGRNPRRLVDIDERPIFRSDRRVFAHSLLLRGEFSIEAASREIAFLIEEILKQGATHGPHAFSDFALAANCQCQLALRNRCATGGESVIKCFHVKLRRKGKIWDEIKDPKLALARAVGAAYNSYSILKARAAIGSDLSAWLNPLMQSNRTVSAATFILRHGPFRTRRR